MKYIRKNIIFFLKNEKIIFLLVVLCIITSSFVINFSYGLFQNFNVAAEEEEKDDIAKIYIDINDSTQVTKNKMRDCVFSISGETNDAINMYLVYPLIRASSDETLWDEMDCRFAIKNNHLYPCEIFYNNLKEYGNWKGGEYFSEQNEINGDLVAIADWVDDSDESGLKYSETHKITTKIENGKRWISVQGKEYEVIGYHNWGTAPLLPFESLDDDTELEKSIFLTFDNPITRPQYNEVREAFERTFGDAVTVPDLDIPEAESYYLYNTIILISIMIAIFAAINFAVLYKYILSKRTKTLAVFRICGCTKLRALRMFLSECMMIAVPLFALTTLVYDKFVLPKLGQHFEYIESAYSLKLYLLIFGIYIAATFVVLLCMISRFLRKTIREAKEEK